MAIEQQHHPAQRRRQARPLHFVGRRQGEAAEVYAVSATEVTRLRSACRFGEPILDWHGSGAARMELSHVC